MPQQLLTLEALLSRPNVPVLEGSCLNSALVSFLFHGIEGPDSVPPPLNLSLVVDNSESMYGQDQRIERAIEAAHRTIDMLSAQDIISVVAFSSSAEVIQAATPIRTDRSALHHAVESVRNIPSFGTSLYRGMERACREVHRNLSRDRINRVLLLTDGETMGPQKCIDVAQKEVEQGLVFSCFGIGDSWNQPLLAQVAGMGRGRWHYIADARDIPMMLEQELTGLQHTVLQRLSLDINVPLGVEVVKAHQVAPEITELPLERIGSREYSVSLGDFSKDSTLKITVELALPPHQPGRYQVAQMAANYDHPGAGMKGVSTEPVNLVVTYTADQSQLWREAEVVKYERFQKREEMVRRGTQLVESGDREQGTRLLRAAARLSSQVGDQNSKLAINDALSELAARGKISRGTSLTVLDNSRKTRLLVEGDGELDDDLLPANEEEQAVSQQFN